MNKGAGQFIVGSVGVFAAACYVGYHVGALVVVPDSTDAPQQPSYVASTSGNERSSADDPATRPLEGEALRTAVREVAEFAATASETDVQYVTRVYRLAERIPLKEFPNVLKSLKEGGTARNAMVRADLLTYWMERDFKAARAYFIAMPAKDRDWMGKVADAWVRVDSESLVAWLKSLPENERKAIAKDVRWGSAGALAQRDPVMAFEVLASIDDGRGSYGEIESTIYRHWARKDPQAAAAHVLQMPTGVARRRAFSSVMEEWVGADPAAAREWVLQITDPDLAREAASELGTEMLETDPEAALKFAAEQGVLEQFKFVSPEAYSDWVKRDGAGAVEWARTLGDAQSRDTILPRILAAYAKQDPRSAAGIYLAETGGGAMLDGAGGDIVRELGKAGQLDYAISFVSQLPEASQLNVVNESCWGLLQELDAQVVVDAGLKLPSDGARHRWMDCAFSCIVNAQGFEKARQVLDGMPENTERQVAAATLIEDAISRNQEQVVALSNTVPDGHASLVKAADHWLDGDNPTAARNWINQTDALTPEEKQRILKPPTPRKNPAAGTAAGTTTGASQKGSLPRP